ncbi:TPA: MafI family immunity protein [Proteus mirabilis]|nr:MafI family immunity protein [Proteus mirabilis]EKU4147112.1 MafI family immunity protein [Proteus mirabilis]EKW1741917.1 MafI family immunity protein [Proteus mirabilis]KKC57692.1 hypothetical protein WG83_18270 [Proteus mirabilis]MBI6308782.1 MafI family immunity protein [Proteus mirabilis]MBI6393439.1 MafI family immunity protein [Proteus mirabilis]
MMNEFYNFGLTFSGRLTEEQIKFALSYLEFNEWGIALDTFCTYLCDENVNINLHEYDTLLRFNQEMGMPLSRNVILYLRNLVSQ